VPPQPRDPDIAAKLVAAAARLLAEEGRAALTARRLGAEVGASSMAVYTYFGGMDELLVQVWREGFHRFGKALAAVRTTKDPVADWMVQGWAYRRFALSNPDLYAVMFDDARVGFLVDDPADRAAGLSTFEALVHRVEACVAAGRWHFVDALLASEVIWVAVHGHCTLELAKCLATLTHPVDAVFTELAVRLSVSFGDDPVTAGASARVARRRAAQFR